LSSQFFEPIDMLASVMVIHIFVEDFKEGALIGAKYKLHCLFQYVESLALLETRKSQHFPDLS
jgi:hypothetical protein